MASQQSENSSTLCECGVPPVLRTSQTSNNPGRCFFGCRYYPDGCGFFKWEASSRRMPERLNNVDEINRIVGRLEQRLDFELKERENLEKRCSDLQQSRGREERKKQIAYFVVIALFFFIWVR